MDRKDNKSTSNKGQPSSKQRTEKGDRSNTVITVDFTGVRPSPPSAHKKRGAAEPPPEADKKPSPGRGGKGGGKGPPGGEPPDIEPSPDDEPPRRTKALIKRAAAEHKKLLKDPFFRLSEAIEKAVEYLWPPYIPYSLITMIEGRRYQGKSYLLHWIIAHATRGRSPQFAMNRENHDKTDIEPMRVLYLTKENPSDIVLKPRVRVMGGDATKIYRLDDDLDREYYDLVFDEEGQEIFEQKVLAFRPNLIGIDPINSFVPKDINVHLANEIKPLLEKLGRIAAKVGATMIIVRHWRKSGGSAMDMAAGITDIGAVARSAIAVASDRKDDDIRYMAHVGLTVGKKGSTLKFHLDGHPTADLFWDGTSDLTADDLVKGGEKSALDAAKDFLLEYLKDGPKLRDDVETAGEARSHSQPTIRRAREELGVIAKKERGVQHGRWSWSLPNESSSKDK